MQVEGWRRALAAGVADELCDRIVTTRPVPDRLLRGLAAVPTLRERDVNRYDLKNLPRGVAAELRRATR